jgi:holo-[acyl-carrier protein] synthase
MLFWPLLQGRLTLMILGIGNDICDVKRMAGVIQRHGRRFLDRTFTQSEQALAQCRSEPCLFYAGRFAAKEAFVKALGTGIIEQVHWTDIEILASRSGQPIATISGGALTRLRRLADRGIDTVVHVSISHDARFATALVILEARDRPGVH